MVQNGSLPGQDFGQLYHHQSLQFGRMPSFGQCLGLFRSSSLYLVFDDLSISVLILLVLALVRAQSVPTALEHVLLRQVGQPMITLSAGVMILFEHPHTTKGCRQLLSSGRPAALAVVAMIVAELKFCFTMENFLPSCHLS